MTSKSRKARTVRKKFVCEVVILTITTQRYVRRFLLLLRTSRMAFMGLVLERSAQPIAQLLKL